MQGPAQAKLGVEALGIQRDCLAQDGRRLVRPAEIQQRTSHAAVRRSPAEHARKGARHAPRIPVQPQSHKRRDGARPDSGPVHLDRLFVPA